MPGNTAAFVLASAVAGLIAAIVMNYPMAHQPNGYAPAYAATDALSRRDLEAVPTRDALIVHHLAGPFVGVVYAALVLASAAVLPTGRALVGVPLVPHVFATLAVVTLMYAVFAHVVLPLTGVGRYEEAETAVRGQWLRSTLVFGAALAVLVPVLSSIVT